MKTSELNDISQVCYVNELPDQPPFFVSSSLYEEREWRLQVITKPSETSLERLYYSCHTTIEDLKSLFLKSWQKIAKAQGGYDECIELVTEAIKLGNLNIKKFEAGCSAFEFFIASSDPTLPPLTIHFKRLDEKSEQLDLFDLLLEQQAQLHRSYAKIRGMNNASSELVEMKKDRDRYERKWRDADFKLNQRGPVERAAAAIPVKRNKGPTNLVSGGGPVRKIKQQKFEDSDEDED